MRILLTEFPLLPQPSLLSITDQVYVTFKAYHMCPYFVDSMSCNQHNINVEGSTDTYKLKLLFGLILVWSGLHVKFTIICSKGDSVEGCHFIE